jgi:hypothetical protein
LIAACCVGLTHQDLLKHQWFAAHIIIAVIMSRIGKHRTRLNVDPLPLKHGQEKNHPEKSQTGQGAATNG